MRRVNITRLLKVAVGMGAAGMVFGSGCGSSGLQAVVAGLEAAASQLEQERDDDISFGDWLRDELEDL